MDKKSLDYYEKRDAKAKLAHALMTNGWEVFEYKPDKSDMRVDYWDPASWGGVAKKGDAYLIVDRPAKYERSAFTFPDGYNAKPNPPNTIWHVEKEGIIVGKGTGLASFYDPNDHLPEIRKRTEAALKTFISKIEQAAQKSVPKFKATSPTGQLYDPDSYSTFITETLEKQAVASYMRGAQAINITLAEAVKETIKILKQNANAHNRNQDLNELLPFVRMDISGKETIEGFGNNHFLRPLSYNTAGAVSNAIFSLLRAKSFAMAEWKYRRPKNNFSKRFKVNHPDIKNMTITMTGRFESTDHFKILIGVIEGRGLKFAFNFKDVWPLFGIKSGPTLAKEIIMLDSEKGVIQDVENFSKTFPIEEVAAIVIRAAISGSVLKGDPEETLELTKSKWLKRADTRSRLIMQRILELNARYQSKIS